MRSIISIISLLLIIQVTGQQFYVSDAASVNISDGAILEIGGDLENDGSIEVGETTNGEAIMNIGGDLINNFLITNRGTLGLSSDWITNNQFLGLIGNLTFTGLGNQTIHPDDLQTSGLTINSSGVVSIIGNEFTVIDRINFLDGILVTSDATQFTLRSTAQVDGGSTDSHFQGRLTYQGSGIREFPIGYQGQYAPLTLLSVVGSDPEFTVFYENPNPQQPVPGDDLLGVSHFGLWEIEMTSGSVSSETTFEIEFSNENLQNFIVPNDIRHNFKSPVIAYADAPEGVYSSLGVETLLDTDSETFTYGTITSEFGVLPTSQTPLFYLAMAMAPTIDPDGLVFIPQAFSPNAADDVNQTFKVLGEKINDENFLLEIYDKFGTIVYSTNSFLEAKQNGWDGINQRTKLESPPDTYYYYVVLEKENGEVISRKDALLLVR